MKQESSKPINLGTVQFHAWRCNAMLDHYLNGQTAIRLLNCEDGSPIACATVNVPTYKLGAQEVIIKDWFENEGMLDALLKAGIVKDLNKRVSVGNALGHVCLITY